MAAPLSGPLPFAHQAARRALQGVGLHGGWVGAYSEAEWLPQWASPDQQNSMVGSMGDSVLADAIAKSKWGILEGIDTSMAYEAIRKDAFVQRESMYGREGLNDYIEKGYVPSSDSEESVTETQGYWLADASISEAAEALGKLDDANKLAARSQGYRKLFNRRHSSSSRRTAVATSRATSTPSLGRMASFRRVLGSTASTCHETWRA